MIHINIDHPPLIPKLIITDYHTIVLIKVKMGYLEPTGN